MSVVVFSAMRLLPGDVIDIMMGMQTTPTEEMRAILEHQYGLDQPLPVQYLRWMSRVIRGDLGLSMRTREPVVRDLLRKLPITFELTILSVVLSVIIAVPLGVVSAVKANSATDFASRILGMLGLSLPNFWLATMLMLVASRFFHWLPAPIFVPFFKNPIQNLQQMLMPTLSLALLMVANMMRMTRSTMLDVLGQDYVAVARSKGLTERAVVLGHVLKNASIPVVTLIGMNVGYLLAGAVIVEQIFALPGLGWFLVNALYMRDYISVQACVLVVCFFFALVNLLVDLLYAYLDPRIGYA
jgi:peptide/nickel transport system permease protein